MGPLQEFNGHRQHFGFGKGQMILQNRHLILLVGISQLESWLETAKNVVGDFIRRLILVHRNRTAKVRMSGDRNARHDRLNVAAMIQQRSEARPRLLVHPIAFVQKTNAASQHRGHQW